MIQLLENAETQGNVNSNSTINKIVITMDHKKAIAVFESRQIRRHYDEKTDVWYFSLVDIVEALTDSTNATDYLKKLRKRDAELNTYIGTNCPQVPMFAITNSNALIVKNERHKII